MILISETIREKISGLRFGILAADNTRIVDNDPHFDKTLNELSEYLMTKFSSKRPSEDEIIGHVRRMYRRIGWEPTRYRPSSEALVRRIIQGKGLYRINNLVDYGNIVSARFHLPMGLYDFEKIRGNAVFDVGISGESYRGISKELIHAEGKLILRDDEGIFGNPTADSLRTAITQDTRRALVVFFCPPEVGRSYLQGVLETLESNYRKTAEPDRVELSILQP